MSGAKGELCREGRGCPRSEHREGPAKREGTRSASEGNNPAPTRPHKVTESESYPQPPPQPGENYTGVIHRG